MVDATRRPPSVDTILGMPAVAGIQDLFGRRLVKEAVRDVVRRHSTVDWTTGKGPALVETFCRRRMESGPRRVFNLTGTVLHTNLGRAPLSPAAIEAMMRVASGASALEYDLATGRRGNRAADVGHRLQRLTGAESALVVNNNAAAIMLLLNTLALRRQVPVSRGELVEIGGAFRMPAIMARAGARMVEVGTTNRTHLADYEEALGPGTGLLLKVHTSNYVIEGFTSAVEEAELARLARDHGVPFAVDLGSGALVDFSRWGLPREPVVAEVVAHGADLVTFSGDKLLGGPQAGIVVGRADLVGRMAANPMMRAMRPDKMTLAALDATLALYEDPDSLPRTLPGLSLLTRSAADIAREARDLESDLASALAPAFTAEVVPLESQIGSGAQPVTTLASAGFAIRPAASGRGSDRNLRELAAALRRLPRPVIGSLRGRTLFLDLRCLDDSDTFRAGLRELERP
ncbi:MAG: L-seryl-tRNA(Sec) selenium transferase [bacterium]|nr:L-seryl-tRNA(Sec) selenium transferase [bacterium]